MIDEPLLERIEANDASLIALDFSYQNLTLEDLIKLTKALEHNTHVTSLNLAGNYLGDKVVPILQGISTLTTLNLAGNSLTSDVAESLSHYPSLTELDISYNFLGTHGAICLARSNQISKLIMIDNQVESDGLEAFAENTSLIYLDLASNVINSAGAGALARNRFLIHLGLYDNFIGNEGAIALAHHKTLISLNLGHNEILACGIKALAVNDTLHNLNLDSNCIGVEGATYLASNTTLLSLSLADAGIGNEGTAVLSNNKTLRELNLSFNQIDDVGVENFEIEATQLKLVSLNFNRIGYKGATALANCHSLQWLSLAYNLIQDTAAIVLSHSSSLTYLDLTANQIGFEGCFALAKNRVLKTLKVHYNFIGDKGIAALARSPSLENLGIHYNGVSNVTATILAENTHLQKLEACFNPLGVGHKILREKKNLYCREDVSTGVCMEVTLHYRDIAFMNTHDFICICHQDRSIMFFNPTFMKIFGYDVNELLGLDFEQLFHPYDKKSGRKLMAASGSLTTHAEIRCLNKGGYPLNARFSCRLKENYIYVSGAEISAWKKYDAALRREEELKTKAVIRESTDFISRICHEIRNPLSGTFGLIDNAKEGIQNLRKLLATETHTLAPNKIEALNQQIKEVEEAHNTMLMCAEYQQAILNDNLDLCKIEQKMFILEKRPCELSELLQQVIIMMKTRVERKELTFWLNLPLQKIYIQGDILRLKQIIINLLTNAIKFTQHGSIAITLSIVNETSTLITSKIEVSDTGIGLDPGEMTKIFQRYYSAGSAPLSQPGYTSTGLGLYLTKNLVELMSGHIFVASEKHKGTTFSCVVPFDKLTPEEIIELTKEKEAASSQPPATPLLPAPAATQQDKFTVLLVEDEPINLKILVRFLDKTGYKVLTATNGEEAVRLYADPPHKIDIILMDIIMPTMNGLEAAKLIRAQEKEKGRTKVPIIALSGQALESEKQEAFKAGMDHFIAKPFVKEELLKIIQTLILAQADCPEHQQLMAAALPPHSVLPSSGSTLAPTFSHSTMFKPTSNSTTSLAPDAGVPFLLPHW